MAQPKKNWIKVAEHINELAFASNDIAVIEIDGRKICVAKKGEEVFAFAYRCPHAGGLLSQGFLDPNGNIVCPLHRYRFDLCNGRNVSGEGYYLTHWRMKVEEKEGVFIEI